MSLFSPRSHAYVRDDDAGRLRAISDTLLRVDATRTGSRSSTEYQQGLEAIATAIAALDDRATALPLLLERGYPEVIAYNAALFRERSVAVDWNAVARAIFEKSEAGYDGMPDPVFSLQWDLEDMENLDPEVAFRLIAAGAHRSVLAHRGAFVALETRDLVQAVMQAGGVGDLRRSYPELLDSIPNEDLRDDLGRLDRAA